MNVLFVCTGNTCRSPMAEYYLKSKNIDGLNVSSAGLSFPYDPASENAVKVMAEIGIDISLHKSRVLNAEAVEKADKIICMTKRHKDIVLSFFPSAKDKVSVLGNGISDPYGKDENAYRKTRDEIIKNIDNFLDAIC